MPAPGRAPVPPSRPPSSSAATPSRTTRISPCPSTWCTSASRRGARRWDPDGRPSARLPPSSSPSPTRTRERPGTASASTSTGPSRGSRGTWGRRADAPAPTFGGTPGGRAWRLEFCNSCVVLLRNEQVPRRNSDSHLVFSDPTQLRAKKRI
jgi:hypothetical protein